MILSMVVVYGRNIKRSGEDNQRGQLQEVIRSSFKVDRQEQNDDKY